MQPQYRGTLARTQTMPGQRRVGDLTSQELVRELRREDALFHLRIYARLLLVAIVCLAPLSLYLYFVGSWR